MNHLFYSGDNLDGLRRLAELGIRADLVYIDPPFATNNEFLIDDQRANAISASGRLAYSDRVRGNAYLDALRRRLCDIRYVMSPTGSVYVHIDVKMEHHVRLLMDDVFGPQNFRNSISRIKCNPKNFDRYSYGNVKDTILFYSVSPERITWHPQREPLDDDEVAKLYPHTDALGRRYTTTPLHAPGVTTNGATGQPWRGMSPPAGRHWRYGPERLDDLDAAGLIEWSTTGNPAKFNTPTNRPANCRRMSGSTRTPSARPTQPRRTPECWNASSAPHLTPATPCWTAMPAAAELCSRQRGWAVASSVWITLPAQAVIEKRLRSNGIGYADFPAPCQSPFDTRHAQ